MIINKIKIISGGQTGVDRAALDSALELGIPCGGWCPKGRIAEDGVIDEKYPLQETPLRDYSQRTEWNVRDSDGTLVLGFGKPSSGTLFTIETAKKLEKPFMILDLKSNKDDASFKLWLQNNGIRTLNIAGPRESLAPGDTHRLAKIKLIRLFEKLTE
ncbi:MAG: putative molybdenum carrier protein [Deltaproteobacteria bacterium]|nr:putative molybdenum carrier protein [Deltaproteobacteria bacterium]